MPCSECEKLFNDDPPCHECSRPKILFPSNELSLRIWRLCAYHSRQVAGMGGILPLSLSEIKIACDIYDADLTDFEKVVKIEQAIFPLLQERESEKSKSKKSKK